MDSIFIFFVSLKVLFILYKSDLSFRFCLVQDGLKIDKFCAVKLNIILFKIMCVN